MDLFQILQHSFNHIWYLLHSRVKGYCWFETKSNNTFRQLIPHWVVPLRGRSSPGSAGRKLISLCRLVMANLHIVAAFDWNGREMSTSILKYGITPQFVLCRGNWVDNCATGGGFVVPMTVCHRGHNAGSTHAPRRGCPWRGFLSVAGLSLIYGGHHWLAGGTGGARAPSFSQPQVMTNYIFISLWSGWTRTDLWPQPETDMDPNHLSSRSARDMPW